MTQDGRDASLAEVRSCYKFGGTGGYGDKTFVFKDNVCLQIQVLIMDLLFIIFVIWIL